MSFSVEKMPGEPIIITTINEDFDFATESKSSDQALLDILGAAKEPHIQIVVLNMKLNFDDMMVGTSNISRGENALWHHPNIKQILLVTNDEVVETAAEGLKSELFGNLNVRVFGSLNQALAYARSN